MNNEHRPQSHLRLHSPFAICIFQSPIPISQHFNIMKAKLTLLAITLLSAASAVFAAGRPNIVFIFSDDHAYQAISAYGDPRNLIQTPNIDRLAQEGMRFDRCLVPNSICGPSRATVLTGKYSHINGFYNNTNSRFDGSQTTFPKLLQAAGYQTAIIGKWHLVSDPTGFDYWEILPGQGVYYNPPMIRNGRAGQARGLRHRHHHRPRRSTGSRSATSRSRSC